ncbi:MAG: NAD(+)/NADH kinase [Candidatus Krumholzibacteria bacterium]|nr:NAD(+)/NADH kinase [Candidatus Krumholzibacteria bacterium]
MTNKTIKTVGLFGNPTKQELPPAAVTITTLCQASGVAVHASEDLRSALPGDITFLPNEELINQVDVVIAFGGDGTMLRAARVLGQSGVPLLGVNLGSLGYLTDVPLEELATAMTDLLAGDYHLDARSRVYCSVWRDGERIASSSALNDLVVNMGPLPRALDMELFMDGDSLGRFLGDGIIISTPTGSTAYNLSAGGPICQSKVPCLLVAPICPHSLGMRPLIVADDTDIELILHETGEGAVLTADGQKTHVLADGDRLNFKEAHQEVVLVKFPHSSFYRVMRHKLNWGGPRRRIGDGS